VISLLVPAPFSIIAFFSIVAIMVFIPIIYSYRIFRDETRETDQT
jgi:hypothetical protein